MILIDMITNLKPIKLTCTDLLILNNSVSIRNLFNHKKLNNTILTKYLYLLIQRQHNL